MTASLSLPAKTLQARSRPALAFMLLAIACATALGLVVTNTEASAAAVAQAGPDLVRLLRGMALIKVLFAACAMGVVLWRLAVAPIAPPWLALYAAACAAMAAGPGLIWHMDFVRTGAALLHGGLLLSLLLVWRDPAVSERLAALVAARRAR
jgi:hypothetical protein